MRQCKLCTTLLVKHRHNLVRISTYPWTCVCMSHFTCVYRLTTLLYVTGGRVLVGATSWWSGCLGGGAGPRLLVGPGLRLEPGKLRLGGGWSRSALRLGGLRRRHWGQGWWRGLAPGRSLH